jgi:hypothetical protein
VASVLSRGTKGKDDQLLCGYCWPGHGLESGTSDCKAEYSRVNLTM